MSYHHLALSQVPVSLRPLLLVAAAFCAACEERPPEFGVSVFADDTLPAIFTVSITGSLGIGLRSEAYQMQPDSSLIMTTPAQLIIQLGAGTAIITSLHGGRLAVQPIGVSADSAELVTVEGTVVKLVRAGEERRVTLSVERP